MKKKVSEAVKPKDIQKYLKQELESYNDLSHSVKAILEHFEPDDLRPKFTRISRKTGVPVTTLLDSWNRLRKKGRIKFSVSIGVEETVRKIRWFPKEEPGEVLLKRK